MTNPQLLSRDTMGSFAEATRFRLSIALGLSYTERLRDLDAMWDFNDVIERQNPRVQDIAARLREQRELKGKTG
jgi:hypothetical protein